MSGRISAHSKNFLPGNLQNDTKNAHRTPIITEKKEVPKTRIAVENTYLPRTVLLK